MKAGAALEPEPLERARALDGEQREVVGDVAHVRAAQLVLLDPGEVGLAFAALTTSRNRQTSVR